MSTRLLTSAARQRHHVLWTCANISSKGIPKAPLWSTLTALDRSTASTTTASISTASTTASPFHSRSYSTTRNSQQSSTKNGGEKQNKDTEESTKSKEPEKPQHKQAFANIRIEAEEWDPERNENPFYRPKYQNRAKILQEDEFKRRPTVGFSEAFENLSDGMITMSWMTHEDQKDIYNIYKEMLQRGYEKYGVTSHEYVIRVVAQKFNITAERVAGVVLLQFNQEKYEIDGSREVDYERGRYMDYSFMQEINDCYRAYKMKPPRDLSLIETVLARGMPQDPKEWRTIDDIFDFDDIWYKYHNEYLPKKARQIVQEHVFLEDVDDEKKLAPIDKDIKSLVDQHEKFTQAAKEVQSKDTPSEILDKDQDRPERRKRYKYIAQVVNTRALKKKHKETLTRPVLGWHQPLRRQNLNRSYRPNSPENTLVEYDGKLRSASMKDVKEVSWKPMRHRLGKTGSMSESLAVQEFSYRTVKQDWLNYIQGKPHSGVFGEKVEEEETPIPGRRARWDRLWGKRGEKEQEAAESE